MFQNSSLEMKKMICTFLVFIMTIGFLPIVTVQADDKGVIEFRTESLDRTLTQAEVSAQLNAAGVISSDTYAATFDETVKSIGFRAFANRSGIRSVNIPDSVTEIGAFAFAESGVTNAVIGDSVTSIGAYAFADTNLADLVIGDKVINIGERAFSYTRLTSVAIPDSVTTLGDGVFRNCALLANVVISNSLGSIGRLAFAECDSLTAIIIPDTVTSIGDEAFLYCRGLTGVIIPANITSIGNAIFGGCTGLAEIEVNEGNNNYSSQDGILFNKDKTTLVMYPAGKSGGYIIPNGLECIGDYSFKACTGLTNVVIPNSVMNIGEGAFSYCSSLAAINMGSSVESIGDTAFSACISLETVVVPDSVTYIGDGAFLLCDSLEKFVIGGSVRHIGNSAFLGTGIDKLSLPLSVTEYGVFGNQGPFAGMTKLSDIVFEKGTTAIPDNALTGISGDVNVYVPKSVTSISAISGFGQNTKIFTFAGSSAENYAEENGIPYEILPTILTEEPDAPQGYQYLPYSFKFESTEGAVLISKPGVEWPDGLYIAMETSPDSKRVRGEIYGAPRESGAFEVTIQAESGVDFFKDEVTFTIDIAENLPQTALEAIINKGRLTKPMGNYYAQDDIYIVDIYDTDPEDKVIEFDCEYDDFIDLWIDGMLMVRDYDLQRNGDYYATRGSIIITLYGQTLARLDPNVDHVVAIELKDGGKADGDQYKVAQSFRIRVVERPNDPGNNDNDNNGGGNNDGNNNGGGNNGDNNNGGSGGNNNGDNGSGSNDGNNDNGNNDNNGGNSGDSSGTTAKSGSSPGTGGSGAIPSTSKTPSVPLTSTPSSPTQTSPTQTSQTPEQSPSILDFSDVRDSDWFAQDVLWAYQNSIMLGVSETEFAPYAAINSAMVSVTLARMLGVDLSGYDAEDGSWFTAAFAWAKEQGLFDGIDELSYDAPYNRVRLASTLARLMGDVAADPAIVEGDINIADEELMSANELEAVKLLYQLGILRGKENGAMDPQGITIRAELATVLHRTYEYVTELRNKYSADFL